MTANLRFFAFFLLAALFPPFAQSAKIKHPNKAASQQDSAIIQALRQKLAHVNTVQADIELSSSQTLNGKSVHFLTSKGKLYAALPSRLRLDMTTQVMDSDPVKTDIYRDAHLLWLVVKDPSKETASFLGKLDLDELQKKLPQISAEALNNPALDLMALNLSDAKILSKSALDNIPVYVLEGKLNPQTSIPTPFETAAGSDVRIRLWVGVHDGLTYQAVMLDKASQEKARMQLANVKINGIPDQNVFQFQPPQGIAPQDMTPFIERGRP